MIVFERIQKKETGMVVETGRFVGGIGGALVGRIGCTVRMRADRIDEVAGSSQWVKCGTSSGYCPN